MRAERRLSEIRAFDYDQQRWIEGEEARRLRIKQLEEELEILEGEGGQAYVEFVKVRGSDLTVEKAREFCVEAIGALKGLGVALDEVL